MNVVQQPRTWWRLFIALIASVTGGTGGNDVAGLGQRLFSGQEQLSERIYTHSVDMPSAAIRCSNCHAAGNGPAVPRSLAPRLNRTLLLDMRARRGGPASKYNRAAFCTVLRKGVDPVYIVIDVTMPRYKLTEDQCMALWAFLTGDT